MAIRSRSEGGLLTSESSDSVARPWRAALIVTLIGLLLTAIFVWWLRDRGREEAAARLADQGEALAQSVHAALNEVIERLVGVGSLYQASDRVSQEEFRRFVANFDPIPGMRGIGYMPIVRAEELERFEEDVSKEIPGYYVFELDGDGERVPVGDRSFYIPVQWFEPGDEFEHPQGFDSASEQNRLSALLRARTAKEPAMTVFLQLLSEDESDGFLIYWPITGVETNEVTGFSIAPMDLGDLLDGQVDPALSEHLTWDIEVLTRGRSPQRPAENTWTTAMDVGSIWWGLTVTAIDGVGFPLDQPETNLALVAIVGVATTLLAATVAYQFRRRSETQKELANLKALTRAKDQFLASVSHELRTPLTGVLGFAELLRDGHDDLTDDERRSMIASVAAEATDLSSIIDDLLVAARSELDLLAITSVKVSLRAQVSQVLETTDSHIVDRIESIGESRGSALGDPGRVRQIIRNLITNAGRYGGDRIQIRLSLRDDMEILEVADNGPGVPAVERERIFEPYYRAHSADHQPAALGIGLSVARHLARLMGGDLSYRREAGWSVFRLALPATVASEAEYSTHLESVSG